MFSFYAKRMSGFFSAGLRATVVGITLQQDPFELSTDVDVCTRCEVLFAAPFPVTRGTSWFNLSIGNDNTDMIDYDFGIDDLTLVKVPTAGTAGMM